MKLKCLAVTVIAALVCAPTASAEAEDVTAVLAAVDVPGAVAVVRDGTTVTQYSAGVADLIEQRPFVPHTHIRAASITKTFVAAAIMQLVAEGAIGLDTPASTYLPGRLPDDITVRQLLRHQSGLAEFFDFNEDLDAYTGPLDGSELLAEALAQPLVFAPGSQLVYTNTNYLVLGEIIRAVTGRSYVDEVTSRIIGPLGLSDTYFPAPGDRGIAAPFASGYEVEDGVRVDETQFAASLDGAAGALVSSGEDTTTFVTALLSGRLVPAAQLAEMMQTVPQFGADVGYGLGLASFTLSCGVTVWGHAGDLDGYHTLMVKPVGDGPALSVTFTQASQVAGLMDDPRAKVAEALYC